MKRLLLAVLFTSITAPYLFAAEIVVDNIRRDYIEYVPKNLGENRPLLISCHGMNQDAAYQKGMLQIESIADTAKFVTIFPNGIDKGWDISGDRDINYVIALIDEMATKYKIDRNRVYLSGFSMGGMFTYHAMNKIADKIAAFAPISGYPMWGGNFNSSRPVPIIHTHGTTDDVVNFGGVANILAGWVKRNGCPTKAKVVSPYRANHITRHTWGPGENGVEVVLMELANKGHWISNDVVKSGEEIWKFCSRYSLKVTRPSVHITSPRGEVTHITFGGASEEPPVTVEATADDPNGQVVKMAFYDGDVMLGECLYPPFQCEVEGLAKGVHTIRAIATDNDGETGYGEVTISVLEPTGTYVFSNTFHTEGSVPDGWTTYDGNERRIGFSAGYSSGSRIFHFTGESHDFDYGLYTRNVTGQHHAGYARFGENETLSTLTLYPGNYQLYMRIANWNQQNFSPFTVALETIEGNTAFTQELTPTSNIGNSAANSFSGTTLHRLSFDIPEKGRYTLSFYTADAPWADLVVGQTALIRRGPLSDIDAHTSSPVTITRYYNLAGQRIQKPAHGIYIQQTISNEGTQSKKIHSL